MSDEEGSSGSEEEEEDSGSEEEELKDEKIGISKEDLQEDMATLMDIAKYIDNTRDRITAKLLVENSGSESAAPRTAAPPPVPDYVSSTAYESAEERQRAMLLDKAIMVLMNDGGGKS